MSIVKLGGDAFEVRNTCGQVQLQGGLTKGTLSSKDKDDLDHLMGINTCCHTKVQDSWDLISCYFDTTVKYKGIHTEEKYNWPIPAWQNMGDSDIFKRQECYRLQFITLNGLMCIFADVVHKHVRKMTTIYNSIYHLAVIIEESLTLMHDVTQRILKNEKVENRMENRMGKELEKLRSVACKWTESVVAYKVQDKEEEEMSFEEVVTRCYDYITAIATKVEVSRLLIKIYLGRTILEQHFVQEMIDVIDVTDFEKINLTERVQQFCDTFKDAQIFVYLFPSKKDLLYGECIAVAKDMIKKMKHKRAQIKKEIERKKAQQEAEHSTKALETDKIEKMRRLKQEEINKEKEQRKEEEKKRQEREAEVARLNREAALAKKKKKIQ